MQQHAERMTTGYFLHDRHQQQVVVVGQIRLLEDRSQLKLVWSHLVMTRFHRNTELPAFEFEILHEGHHTRRDSAEIVIFELLVLGTFVSHQRTTGQNHIGAGCIETLVHQEVLLLPTQIREHFRDTRIKVVAHIRSRTIHSLQRT